MSEMLDRVAKALYKASHSDRTPWLATEFEHIDPDRRNYLRGLAKSVIGAMLDPTDEMLKAGAVGSGEDSENCASGAWRCMIAAALK